MSTELKLSSAPHAHGLLSTGTIMKILVASLIPAIALNVYYYGCGILINIVIACLSCTLSEALILKIRHKNPKLVFIDFSAIVTGVLIALTIPQLTPWYLTVAGSLFAMIIVKHCYGGLGQNIFNPAMAGSLEQVRAGDVMVEFDKIIDRQLERAAISTISGFAKICDGASCVLNV